MTFPRGATPLLLALLVLCSACGTKASSSTSSRASSRTTPVAAGSPLDFRDLIAVYGTLVSRSVERPSRDGLAAAGWQAVLAEAKAEGVDLGSPTRPPFEPAQTAADAVRAAVQSAAGSRASRLDGQQL